MTVWRGTTIAIAENRHGEVGSYHDAEDSIYACGAVLVDNGCRWMMRRALVSGSGVVDSSQAKRYSERSDRPLKTLDSPIVDLQ
jgi:hypothetical protein